MQHFSQIDENNLVIRVMASTPEIIASGNAGDPASWIETNHDTYGGVNRAGGPALRKNFGTIGFTYDAARDAFIPPKKYNSWILNEDTCLWEAPVPRPAEGTFYWDETTLSWVEVPNADTLNIG